MEESGEIEESLPHPTKPETPRGVKTRVPEVEVRLYRQGKGPIAIFKSNLGGWDQDQLEVGDILHKYGFKSVYAFNPESGRGVSIRIHPRNGRSLLPYQDGSVVFIDGEPKVCPKFLPQQLQSFKLPSENKIKQLCYRFSLFCLDNLGISFSILATN